MNSIAAAVTGRGLCDGALLIALLTVSGTALFRLMLAPALTSEGEPPGLRRMQRLMGSAQVLLWPLRLLLVVASMAGTSVPGAIPFAGEVVRDTHYGHAWIAGAPLSLLLAAGLWLRNPRGRARVVSAAGTVLLGLWALSSHAIDLGVVAIAIYFVHEMAAALWIGALLSFWFLSRKHFRNDDTRLLAGQVSATAGWCVTAMALTGLYSAYRLAGLDPRSLATSLYGRVLLVKVGVFALIVAIGAWNRWLVLPVADAPPGRRALARNVAIEAFLVLAVFALAALLANTPPPR